MSHIISKTVWAGVLGIFWGRLSFSEPIHSSASPSASPSASQINRPFAKPQSEHAGVDLKIKFQDGWAACQSSPIAKNEIEGQPGKCRTGLLTAAHCLDAEAESIQVGEGLEISSQCASTRIPAQYFKSGVNFQFREPQKSDSAILVFDTDCEKVKELKPIPLAPVEKNGDTVLETKKVFIEKRQGAVPPFNAGSGKRIEAEVTTNDRADQFRFHVPTPRGYSTVGGDSGGAILNEKGQLICPISASSYEWMRENGRLTRIKTNEDSLLDPFNVVCDKRAISTARLLLEKFGLSTDPNKKVSAGSPSSPADLCEDVKDKSDPNFARNEEDYVASTEPIKEMSKRHFLFRPKLGSRFSQLSEIPTGMTANSLHRDPVYEVVANDVGSISGSQGKVFQGHEAGVILQDTQTRKTFYIGLS